MASVNSLLCIYNKHILSEENILSLSLTTKKSIFVRQAFDKENYIMPVGTILEFISHSHSYHPYYEVHSYKAEFSSEGKPLTLSMTRIQGSTQFKIDGIKLTHHDDGDYLNRKSWNEIFEEDCPIEIT